MTEVEAMGIILQTPIKTSKLRAQANLLRARHDRGEDVLDELMEINKEAEEWNAKLKDARSFLEGMVTERERILKGE